MPNNKNNLLNIIEQEINIRFIWIPVYMVTVILPDSCRLKASWI